MKAVVIEQMHAEAKWTEYPDPIVQKGEMKIKIKAAALNHRDVYIQQGLYPGIIYPVVPGSDGSGLVEEVYAPEFQDWIGKSVILNPNKFWGNNEKYQAKPYQILGMPSQGTLAEYVSIPADRVVEKPSHLNDEQAAALPLAGLTAYRALFSRGKLQAGEKILISGIGGGVALTALQFALAAQAEVWVSSGSQEKINQAMALGAKGGICYNQDSWHKNLLEQSGLFDLIIDSAGGKDFSFFPDLCNFGGRIVFFGGTHGNFTLNPQKVFWKQLDILGSTMGSDLDFNQMISFVSTHQISPLVSQSWPAHRIDEAFQCMKESKQFGKIVIQVQ